MANSASRSSQQWLTLGAASQLVGVSESTIRRWSDAGEVRSFRTRGGHRRILEEDLRLMVAGRAPGGQNDSERISDIALARVKRRLSNGRSAHRPPIFDELDDEARDRLRVLGRQLVDVFARYIASGRRKDRFVDDARMIGREYGRALVASHVGLTAAVSTFNSLRHSLEETASQIASESHLSAEDAVEAIENILTLADVVLEGLAEAYEHART
ncbi:MAG: helix-turn-helix domain-containing protein [Dehalococcoidia bacterium]|nr:helix-turn-helix domain-containing protein [Dehalococcoidia bacterium]